MPEKNPQKTAPPIGLIRRLTGERLIFLILTGFILWRLYFMTRNHDVIWDEAVYLGIGKFLWSAGSSGLWEIIRPLGLPLLLGIPWKLGLDPIFWGELIAIAFSAGCLYLTYHIGRKIHSTEAGITAAILLGITPTFFLYSGYILTDIPAAFFTLLTLDLFIHKRYAWSGFFASIAFMTRYPHGIVMGTLAAAILGYHLIERTSGERLKTMGRFLAAFFPIPAAYMIINWGLYHRETSKAWHAIFRPWILASWHAGNPAEAGPSKLYYITGILSENMLLALILVGIAWFLIRRSYKDMNLTAPLLVFTTYLLYHSSILNKQMRFGIPLIAIGSIYAAYGIMETADWIAGAPERKQAIRAAGLAALVILSSIFFIPENNKYLGWRFEKPQPIVDEIYGHFDRINATGSILTSDPLPAAFGDRPFEPIYFSVDSSSQIYNDTISAAWGILFVPEVYYCDTADTACKAGLAALGERIRADNDLVIEKRYGNDETRYRTYQIWKKKA